MITPFGARSKRVGASPPPPDSSRPRFGGGRPARWTRTTRRGTLAGMTDDEWRACGDDVLLLRAVRHEDRPRACRLLGAAAGAWLWTRLTDPRSLRAVEAAYLHADGGLSDSDLQAAHVAALAAHQDIHALGNRTTGGTPEWCAANLASPTPAGAAGLILLLAPGFLMTVEEELRAVPAPALVMGRWPPRAVADLPGSRRASADNVELIRCIFAPPSRSIAFNPSHRTEAAVALARGMYESRDLSAAPVLADALEDAGCADAAVLGHLRGGGVHVRGCWCVDAVLGLGYLSHLPGFSPLLVSGYHHSTHRFGQRSAQDVGLRALS
jgi:hypothetical protein